MKKKLFACILAIVLCLTQTALLPMLDLLDLSITASAEEYSGICGDNLTWTFNEETGELTISGEGHMFSWGSMWGEKPPWEDYKSLITTITIEYGTMEISSCAFKDCYNLTSVSVPYSVYYIGDFAFSDCYNLGSITIPPIVYYIGEDAFYNCYSLTYVDYCAEPEQMERLEIESGNDFLLAQMMFYSDYKCVVEGVCGENGNITWSLDSETNELVIRGTGNMYETPWHCYRLVTHSVVINDGITSICEGAFYDFVLLEDITIPESVTSIENNAFTNCESLENINIPRGVKSINCGFYECDNLKSINVDENNKYYSSVDGVLFNKEKTKLLLYPQGSGRYSYTVPDGVTSIESSFWNSGLAEIKIPTSVMNIAGGVFDYCVSSGYNKFFLENVYYLGTEEQWNKIVIGDYNYDLDIATIHYNCPPTINGFCGDNLMWKFDEISGELTVFGTGNMSRAPWNFFDLSIKSVTIENGVSSIYYDAFENCDSLTSVTIGNSVTSIGDYAFYSCDSLSSIEISDSVTSIGSSSFQNTAYYNDTSNWENDVLYIGKHLIVAKGTISGEYTIKNNTVTIADYAFASCVNLTSIKFPDSVTVISDYAFKNCINLTSIEFADFVTSIGGYAFSGCSALTSVTIPDSVTSISVDAFSDCSGLTSIDIPDSVTSIGRWAFYNTAYYNNTSNWENDVLYIGKHLIVAGSSISGTYKIKDGTLIIADDAFYSCDSLTGIEIPDSVTNIGKGAFQYCFGLASVEIPDSVTSIDHSAFYGCNFTSVMLGNSVTSIGEWAFFSCDDLTDVYYNGTEEQWNNISIGNANNDLLNATIHFAQAPHEHSYEAVVTAPTCTEGGCTTYTCSCGDSYASDETTALGHSFGEWILTTPPTTESEGEETRTCLRCGETETRAVQKLEDTQKASFTVSSGKVHPGETVEITVNAENNPGIVAAKILLDFDGELLTLTEVRNGEIFADDLMTKGNDITKVPYTVLWKDALSANNTNNGTLVTFVFTAAADAPECTVAIDIEYDPNSTFNADLNNVEFTVEGGKVEILPRIPGDPDGDGKITLKDVVIIERYLADWDVTITDMSNADVDGDGILTLKDAVLIERYLADWDVELI